MVAASAVLGACGTATTVAMFSSPSMVFRLIVRQRDVGEWSVLPYTVGFAQCLFWFVYDVIAGLWMHGCANLFGIIIQLVFISIYAACARGRRFAVIRQFLAITLATGATCAVVLLTAHSWSFLPQPEDERARAVLGFCCSLVCVSMYAAPLDVSRKVIMRRVAVEDCLPWLYSLNIVINLFFWTSYGAVENDANVAIPAGVGMALGLLQLLLYGCYRNTMPRKSAPEDDSGAARDLPASLPASV
jgi:solute carrier family 50 protein (sugar transporter)